MCLIDTEFPLLNSGTIRHFRDFFLFGYSQLQIYRSTDSKTIIHLQGANTLDFYLKVVYDFESLIE